MAAVKALPLVGDVIEFDVVDQPYGPDAIGRPDGLVVFVDAVPGDRVRARVTAVEKRFARARMVEVVSPSPDRIAPPCPVADRCGGCQWQPVRYARQLAAKERAVRDAIERIGGWPAPDVRPIVPSPAEWRYRNKARYSVSVRDGLLVAGYNERSSHDIVPIERCPLNRERLDETLAAAVNLLGTAPFARMRESLVAIACRESAGSGETIVRLIIEGDADVQVFADALAVRCPGLTGVTRNRAVRRVPRPDRIVRGEGYLTEHVGDYRYRVAAATFFQVNPLATPALVDLVREAAGLTGSESLVDLYGGAGLFAVALGKSAGSVTLVESDPGAVADARRILPDTGLGDARIIETDAERLPALVGGADAIVCDPPRGGAGKRALAAMDRLKARRLVYVACDPTSLARDSAMLREMGWNLAWARPVDLFPHTYHVETVARFERR